MATRITDALSEQLREFGLDPQNFAAEFDHWKTLGERGECSKYLFGKDGAYISPRVNGAENVLRHVHLVPLKDAPALAKWDRAWERRSRKTSERALVYVSDPYYGNLLLFILDEPNAHEVAKMRIPEHRELMMKFAQVADQFIYTGKIIV